MLMFLIYMKDSHVRWWHDGETLKDEGRKHYFAKTFYHYFFNLIFVQN